MVPEYVGSVHTAAAVLVSSDDCSAVPTIYVAVMFLR